VHAAFGFSSRCLWREIRTRRAPPRSHQSLRLPGAAPPDEFRDLDVTPLLDDNAAKWRSTRRTLRVRYVPLIGGRGTTREQPTRRSRITHLPTNIVVEAVKMSAVSIRTARAPCKSWKPNWPNVQAPERQAEMNALSATAATTRGVHRFAYRAGAVTTRERPSNGSRNRKRRGGTRRRSR